MKKRIQRITAAFVALCCMPVTGITAGADVEWYWGSTAWDAFEDLEPIDDHGMLTGEDGLLFLAPYQHTCIAEDGTEYMETVNRAFLISPRKNVIECILRENVDPEIAAPQMAEVLDGIFPGLKDGFQEIVYQQEQRWVFHAGQVQFFQTETNPQTFEIWLGAVVPDNAAELEAKILCEFAQRHLLSAYYGLGETADDCQGNFFTDPLDEMYLNSRTDVLDLEAVQAFLDAHHPGYAVECCLTDPKTGYRIKGADALTLREKVELGGELYERFGLTLCFSIDFTGQGNITGHNALERRGDVTLDCALSITDVIALNRNLMANDPLCATAKKNADINGDGTPDEADALAILKEIVEITKDFKEP